MPTDYNVSAITLPAAPVPTLLFMGRPARLTLTIASGTSGVTFVSTSEANFIANLFARIDAGRTLILPVRDFGPLITGEIWVSGSSGGITINGAEIFNVGRSR